MYQFLVKHETSSTLNNHFRANLYSGIMLNSCWEKLTILSAISYSTLHRVSFWTKQIQSLKVLEHPIILDVQIFECNEMDWQGQSSHFISLILWDGTLTGKNLLHQERRKIWKGRLVCPEIVNQLLLKHILSTLNISMSKFISNYWYLKIKAAADIWK